MDNARLHKHVHSCSSDHDPSSPNPSERSATSNTDFIDETLEMASETKEDVNDVLDDVIVKINRITDHLRDKGENEAANRCTQEMTTTLRALYNIIAPWDIEQCLMTASSSSRTFSNECEASTNVQPTVAPPAPGKTWAAIAAREPAANSFGVIKYGPRDNAQQRARQEEARDSRSFRDARDQRVIWIRPWTTERPLIEITDRMRTTGAIYSIAFAPEENAVCVIFQHATCALDFMQRCAEHDRRTGNPPFGPGSEVAPGLLYPMNKDLGRMEMPSMERRRLTFARSGLFTKDGVTQQRFRNDLEEIVGPANVELLWLFNTGNATVIFTAVPLARLVRNTFLRMGNDKSSPYSGVMVGYSHDPCERDMHLVSQIPGHPGYIGNNVAAYSTRPRVGTMSSNGASSGFGHGSNSYFGTPQKRRSTTTSIGKINPDEDGWQTVKKRR